MIPTRIKDVFQAVVEDLAVDLRIRIANVMGWTPHEHRGEHGF
jgi:hypothetical protein